MLDFKAWFAKDNFIDIPTRNGVFTWNNRQDGFYNIAKRLKRFIFKGNLISFNHPFNTIILPNAKYDHYSVRLEIGESQKPSRNPFKCEKMWFLDKDFLNNFN